MPGGSGYGGGGFFSSLLGGLFGAAAGMWLYNNLFGGSYWDSSQAFGGETPPTDAGTSDYDGDGSGDFDTNDSVDTGGDFGGDDFGGGDFDGGEFGGGDFGGGDA